MGFVIAACKVFKLPRPLLLPNDEVLMSAQVTAMASNAKVRGF